MANTHETLTDLFSDIATSVRAKTGSTSTIVADNFPSAIDSITTLKEGSNDATATAAQILSGQTAYVKGAKVTGSMANQGAKTSALNAGGSYTIPAGYHNGSGKITANSLASQTSGTATTADMLNGKIAWVNGNKVTGNIPTRTADNLTASGATVTVPAGYYGAQLTKSVATATQATPSISIDTAGKITASATQSAGYVSSGTKSATKQLTVQAAKTVTPSTSNQTAVSSGVYTTGAVTVAGDADLVAANIKSGVDIFGVTGTYVAPTDTTATAAQILTGKTAYLGGAKTTGTMANRGAVTQTLDAGGSYTIPAGYHNGSGKVTANSLASQTDGTAVAGDILSGKTAYVDGVKITGTIATKTSSDLTASGATVSVPAGYYASKATKSIPTVAVSEPTFSFSNGVFRISHTQQAGYVNGSSMSDSYELTTQAAATITPGTTAKTAVAKNVYTTGAVTVAGDTDLVAKNIKSGVNIFGVTGSYVAPDDALFLRQAAGIVAMPDANGWNSITYGNGRFVAVTSGEQVAYSLDGLNWTSAPISAGTWRSVVYGDGKFVAISALGDPAYSYDGITWEYAGDMQYKDRHAVAYGDGKYVAVGAIVEYSTDCNTWSEAVMPQEMLWRSIAYGNGHFVAVGQLPPRSTLAETNIAAYSNDGVTWALATLPNECRWMSVAYGNNMFVATASDGHAAYSSNGIVWNSLTMPVNAYWTSVAYGDGKFISISSGTSAAYSSDGITWQSVTLPSVCTWSSVTYGDGKYVAIANDSTILVYSFDGTNWLDTMVDANIVNMQGATVNDEVLQKLAPEALFLQLKTSAVPSNSTLSRVEYANGKFITFSNSAYSVDGIHWTPISNTDFVNPTKIQYGNGVFVCAEISTNIAMYSNDGIKWTATMLPAGFQCTDIAYGDGIFIAVSESTDGVAAYTKDGVNWFTTTMPHSDGYSIAAYGNGKFVAILGSGTKANAAYSNNGITWYAGTLPAADYYDRVVFGNGVFVAIATAWSTHVVYSSDGITWLSTSIPNTDACMWPGLTYGNGQFVAVGFDFDMDFSTSTSTYGCPTIACSVDGSTWSTITSPVGFLIDIAFGNDVFVAIAADDLAQATSNGSLMYSYDGLNWHNASTGISICDISGTDVTASVIERLGYFNMLSNANESWVGNLMYSGQYANSTYFTRAGCYLAVDKEQGMAFITTASPNSSAWDRIHYQEFFVPDGITVLAGDPHPKTQTSAAAAVRYFTVAFKGVTGKINANVELYSVDSSYDTVYARVTLTYA